MVVCLAALVAVAVRSRSPAIPPAAGPAPATAAPLGAGPLHPAPAPQSRSGPASSWDPAHGRLLLFGGSAHSDPTLDLGDTWSWDRAAWRRLAPAHSPPARFGAELAPVAGGLMLVGGSHRASPGPGLPVTSATGETSTS